MWLVQICLEMQLLLVLPTSKVILMSEGNKLPFGHVHST